MRTLFVPIMAISALAGGVNPSQAAEKDAPATPPAYTLLNDQASQLRDEFNRSKGSVRLLFVVDPICPGCLRGLDDVNNDLLATTDHPRLQTFVVHVPVIGAQAKDVAPATELLRNTHVRHYWNPAGEFGRQLAQAVELRNAEELVYAWDVWLIYDAQAVWDGASPPQPRLLMHQLRALKANTKFPRLDSKVFAQEVRALLAKLPPTTSASATQE